MGWFVLLWWCGLGSNHRPPGAGRGAGQRGAAAWPTPAADRPGRGNRIRPGLPGPGSGGRRLQGRLDRGGGGAQVFFAPTRRLPPRKLAPRRVRGRPAAGRSPDHGRRMAAAGGLSWRSRRTTRTPVELGQFNLRSLRSRGRGEAVRQGAAEWVDEAAHQRQPRRLNWRNSTSWARCGRVGVGTTWRVHSQQAKEPVNIPRPRCPPHRRRRAIRDSAASASSSVRPGSGTRPRAISLPPVKELVGKSAL